MIKLTGTSTVTRTPCPKQREVFLSAGLKCGTQPKIINDFNFCRVGLKIQTCLEEVEKKLFENVLSSKFFSNLVIGDSRVI